LDMLELPVVFVLLCDLYASVVNCPG
jgi:hypothetical protein